MNINCIQTKSGIWVRSKKTRIAYEVKGILEEKGLIKKILIYNIPEIGNSGLEWWDIRRFDFITPFYLDNFVANPFYDTPQISSLKSYRSNSKKSNNIKLDITLNKSQLKMIENEYEKRINNTINYVIDCLEHLCPADEIEILNKLGYNYNEED